MFVTTKANPAEINVQERAAFFSVLQEGDIFRFLVVSISLC